MPRRKARFPQRHDIIMMEGVAHLVTYAYMNLVEHHWMFRRACDPERPALGEHRVTPYYHRAHKVTCIGCLAYDPEGGEW